MVAHLNDVNEDTTCLVGCSTMMVVSIVVMATQYNTQRNINRDATGDKKLRRLRASNCVSHSNIINKKNHDNNKRCNAKCD